MSHLAWYVARAAGLVAWALAAAAVLWGCCVDPCARPPTTFLTDDNFATIVAAVEAGMVIAPVAALLLRLALSRSREYQADWSGAELIGDGRPLASAPVKLGQASGRVPMHIDAAHATAYIVDPLRWARRKLPLASLLADHPPIDDRIARLSTHPLARTRRTSNCLTRSWAARLTAPTRRSDMSPPSCSTRRPMT